MNRTWKLGAQVALVLLAGGAMMLSGGVASAMPTGCDTPSNACLRMLISDSVGNRSAPVQLSSVPRPCLDLQLPGVRLSIGDASQPVQCRSLPGNV